MTATEAVFESVSGFTTTGATVLVGLDDLPPSILYYRQQIQWLGGIGIVVLAVALLPLLGIGGMQLLKAETPGPMKDAKLTPRIAGTAKALWLVYLLLTAAGVLAYWAAGMSLFDAVGSRVRRRVHRRLLDPRRQHRLLRQPDHRDDHDRADGARRRELRAAFPRLAPPAPRRLLARRGVPRIPCRARRDDARHRRRCWSGTTCTITRSRRCARRCSTRYRCRPAPATRPRTSRCGRAHCRCC